MNLSDLRAHLDARLDRVESKLDVAIERTVKHETKIEQLQGVSNLLVAVVLAVAGFLAAGYFTFLQQ